MPPRSSLEYAYSFLATLRLSLKAARGGRFGAVQSCNPPDIFWPIGLLFKLWHGSRFVFDHHDLCPETFESRFPEGSPVLYRGLRFLERRTIRLADHVISTNESYRTAGDRPRWRQARPGRRWYERDPTRTS